MTAAVESAPPLVLVKDRFWPALKYRPNPPQVLIHGSPSRNRVSAAGRRVGKSTAGGHELIPEAFRAYMTRQHLEETGNRMEYWIVGPGYVDSEKEFRVFYNDCKRLQLPFDKPGTYYDTRSGDMTVSLWEGRFLVTAKSSVHPERLVGEGLHGAIMAEAAKMKESTWSKYVRPTLADFRGWTLFNSTPEGKNWFYEMWNQGQDPAFEDWWSIRAPSWANTAVFPGGRQDREILSLEQELTSEMFNQEIGASFSEYAGRVFGAWDEEIHVGDFEYRSDLPVHIATDYGWTNPNVALFLQVDEFNQVWILDCYYERHRSADEMADDLIERFGPQVDRARTLFPDPEDPSSSYTLSSRLKLVAQGNTGGPIKDRLELIRRWLKEENTHLPYDHPERRPRLHVNRRCRQMIREMDAYRYPERANEVNGAPENPMKKDDHTPEALGRFFAGYFGHKATTAPRQTTAHTTRHRGAPRQLPRRR